MLSRDGALNRKEGTGPFKDYLMPVFSYYNSMKGCNSSYKIK